MWEREEGEKGKEQEREREKDRQTERERARESIKGKQIPISSGSSEDRANWMDKVGDRSSESRVPRQSGTQTDGKSGPRCERRES